MGYSVARHGQVEILCLGVEVVGNFWRFVNSELGLLLVGLALGTIVTSVGWAVKFYFHQRHQKLEYIQARKEKRAEGYENFMAAVNAYQFMRASTAITKGACWADDDMKRLHSRALVILEKSSLQIQNNMIETGVFQKILSYWHWIYMEEHSAITNPGVREFGNFSKLILLCEQITMKHEKAESLEQHFGLTEEHEFNKLVKSAEDFFVTQEGEIIVSSTDGEAMAAMIAKISGSNDGWEVCRDECWVHMEMSGLFGVDLPVRPDIYQLD